MKVKVIGAGLAGSEAAWQLAQRGIHVTLCEMKPEKKTPAHETEYFAEDADYDESDDQMEDEEEGFGMSMGM